MNESAQTQVIVAGGGPCGLVLAIELGLRGVNVIVLNDRLTTTPFPQANATQARTMEHYRRLGIADRIRAAGLPADYTTDAACFTRLSKHEIARFEQPSSGETTNLVRSTSGSWSAAELPHRGAQMFFERILFEKAKSLPSVRLAYGCRVESFDDNGASVSVSAENVTTGERMTISGEYLVGCDGPRSLVRKQLGIQYAGKSGVVRDFMGGRMLQVHLRAPAVYDLVKSKRRAWQYWAINREQPGFITAVDGRGEFVFVIQLRPGQSETDITGSDIQAAFENIIGAECPIEVISAVPWTAGLVLVAESYQKGRVFLGGDAAHLFTPSGGLGYNTAVEDAVNLAWKLAGTLHGWGGPRLLKAYETEMRPLARRNTEFADRFADTIVAFKPPSFLEDDTPEGTEARAAAGRHWNGRMRQVLNIPGITFGGRYDDSPLIVTDRTHAPPDEANRYVPTAKPGGRAPHAWLADGRSLFDAFGREFSLLKLNSTADPKPLMEAASRRGVPLSLVDLEAEGLEDLYQAGLVLIRPDQIVAWRGADCHSDPEGLLDVVTGRSFKLRREMNPASADAEIS